ncbi:NADPH-dependent FMN reductase [Aequorivita sediminis]|uniref:NADPH-dependent FMN reductase n=1 Tax=Aequorivita sediminis TaxID=3073653 RepID=UPI0028AD6A3F|nr:NADPH-dependent FMN reductase [Aequorivita sp. F6058]
MRILGISASASISSSNFYLLKAIQRLLHDKDEMQVFEGLQDFDLFSPYRLTVGIPIKILELKEKIDAAELIIVATPEYTHNIPAVLKNLMEWCTASGEFAQKKVLPITFTPYEPRGEHAMTSLLQSLQTMKAKIETQLPLYKTDVEIKENQIVLPAEIIELLNAAIDLYR